MDVFAVPVRRRRQRNSQSRQVIAFAVIVDPVFVFIERKFIFPEPQDIHLFKVRIFQIDRRQKGNSFPVFGPERKGHPAGRFLQRLRKAGTVCRLLSGPAETVILWQFLQKRLHFPAGADRVLKSGQRYLPFPVQASRFFRQFCQGQETACYIAVFLYAGFRRDGIDFLPEPAQRFTSCLLQYIRQEASVIRIILFFGKLYHRFRLQAEDDLLQGLCQEGDPAFGFFPSVH